MKAINLLIDSLQEKEVRDLVEKFKESQNIYFIRKERGLTFKEFRRIVMLRWKDKEK